MTTSQPSSYFATHETPISQITCAWTAKTRAIPSLHRDRFPAKHDHDLPGALSGNATSLYCRAVMRNNMLICLLISIVFTLNNNIRLDQIGDSF